MTTALIPALTSAVGAESNGVSRLNEQFGYGYDLAGNLVARTNGALTQAFAADAANELTNLTRLGTLTFTGSGNATAPGANMNQIAVNQQGAAIYGDQTFASTTGLALGNGTNVFTVVASDNLGDVVTNVFTANLPLTQTLRYDANGNLTSDGVRGFDYDGLNELIRVTVTNVWKTEYDYDGLGRHHDRREYVWSAGTASWYLVNECDYVYAGWDVVQEVNSTEGTASYVYGQGLLERDCTLTNQPTMFYHTDGNGNVTTLFDNQDATVLGSYLYDPYGNLVAQSGSMAGVNRYRFSGKEYDPHTGLYYFGYRFYDPNLQRWLNQDPIGERGGINLYTYVHNSPVNKWDRLGLEEYSWQAGMYVPSPQDYDDEGNLVGNPDDQMAGALMGQWGSGIANSYEGLGALALGASGLGEAGEGVAAASSLMGRCAAAGKGLLGLYGVASGATKLTGNELPKSISVPADVAGTAVDIYNKDPIGISLDAEGWFHNLLDWTDEPSVNELQNSMNNERIYFTVP